jgi:hypothetical protein
MVKIPLMLGKKLIGRVSKAVSKSREDIRSFRAEKAAERTDSPFNELNKAQERLETAKDVRNTTKDILGTKYGNDSDVNVEFGKTLDEVVNKRKEIRDTLMSPDYLKEISHKKGGLIKGYPKLAKKGWK